jgi:drug/metabolite transporter (DMT)-like permease
MKIQILFSILTALCLGGWPLIARFSKLPSIWVTVMVAIGTVTVALFAFFTKTSSSESLPITFIAIGLLAGIVNGLGIFFYGKLIGTSGWEISRIVPMTFALMVLVAGLGGSLVFGEPITFRKLIGLLTVIISVFLLSS